jgi:hypothetical protein
VTQVLVLGQSGVRQGGCSICQHPMVLRINDDLGVLSFRKCAAKYSALGPKIVCVQGGPKLLYDFRVHSVHRSTHLHL